MVAPNMFLAVNITFERSEDELIFNISSKSDFLLNSLRNPIMPVNQYDQNNSLCGVPGICQSSAQANCYDEKVESCTDCPRTYLVVFVFLATALGFAILLGNSMVLHVCYQCWNKRKLSNFDRFRVSLAMADIIAGFQIFLVTLPNVAWTERSTIEEIRLQQPMLKNSVQAFAGGLFYTLSYVSSIYNLLLLGAVRFYAIFCPEKYAQIPTCRVNLGIGMSWIIAAIVSSIPGWFPAFAFQYNHVTFLYLPTLNITSSANVYLSAIIWLSLVVIFPYILLTIELLCTALVVHLQVSFFRKNLVQNPYGRTISKKEKSTFKTVLLMQLGFTITLIPVGILSILFYSEYLTCSTFSTPYLICFYLSIANSLINVLVYSVREKKFRKSISNSLKKLKPTLQQQR